MMTVRNSDPLRASHFVPFILTFYHMLLCIYLPQISSLSFSTFFHILAKRPIRIYYGEILKYSVAPLPRFGSIRYTLTPRRSSFTVHLVSVELNLNNV